MDEHKKAILSSRRGGLALLATVLLTVTTATTNAEGSFVTFESGQVRPLALTPSGNTLIATNTPDNRIEIYAVSEAGLLHQESVPVGMEPVAVAARSENEVWVINHLSDSVSIVTLGNGATPSRVSRTIPIGDEPRDIVFTGEQNDRAFITTAHRGQHHPEPFNALETQGRADVWVFDALNPGTQPLTIVNLFADTPRGLAVSPDGNTVYAAAFMSGNRTTVLSRETLLGDLPEPLTNIDGVPVPSDATLIVQFDGTDWTDGAGRIWTDEVRMSLPDLDVFAIDATANPPVETASYSGVGTTLFNLAVNPVTGAIYVSNMESRNQVRFEGPGDFGGSTVRAHFVENRITVIDGSDVSPRHLNKHIDYDTFPGSPTENAASLAMPLEMAITSDGDTMYVAAFGSGKIGVFDTAELEDDSFAPSAASHVTLSGGGPTGIVLDEARARLYVLTRFDNSISIVDTDSATELDHVALFNPEPVSVVDGRPFLYDAAYTSSRGDSSCGSCHIFGDMDHNSWDLGNPDGSVLENLNPFRLFAPPVARQFHPMKGAMTTQSLRGMANHGPMHWRGDRSGANDPANGDAMDEDAAFKAFNGAFEGLVGRTAPLSAEEMQAFTDFALQITYPPNPVRPLDNSRTPSQSVGLDIYVNRITDGDLGCSDCHTLSRTEGFFGTSGLSVVRRGPDGAPRQALKTPHLRNLYTKVGFFGASRTAPGQPFTGDQVRGSGFLHDGATDTLFQFLKDFTNINTLQERADLVNFLMAFDSNMAPVVGQQATMAPGNLLQIRNQLVLLLSRSAVTDPVPECDLIVKYTTNGEQRGAVRVATGLFRNDREAEPDVSVGQLYQGSQVPGQEATFTCVPPGSGNRMGIDRDEDGFLDRDEIDAGSDPADAGSIPAL